MPVWHSALAFAWCLLAGLLMSLGAGGGGILVGIGQISLLGVTDPNVVKLVNQVLELVSRVVSVPMYHRQKRLVWSLALAYGIGAPVGAALGAWLSKSYLSNMAVYRPAFGVLTACVACRVLYEGWGKSALAHAGRRRAREASQRAVERWIRAPSNLPEDTEVHTTEFSWRRVSVRFGGEDFEFNPITAAAGGFFIALFGSALGVGGGFLVTPFMASILLFPMYLVVGTGLVALMLPLVVSVSSYIALRVSFDWPQLAIEIPAVALGSFIGPHLSRRLDERTLKTFVALILLLIGLFYIVR
jgi:uncharacterized protein